MLITGNTVSGSVTHTAIETGGDKTLFFFYRFKIFLFFLFLGGGGGGGAALSNHAHALTVRIDGRTRSRRRHTRAREDSVTDAIYSLNDSIDSMALESVCADSPRPPLPIVGQFLKF